MKKPILQLYTCTALWHLLTLGILQEQGFNFSINVLLLLLFWNYKYLCAL